MSRFYQFFKSISSPIFKPIILGSLSLSLFDQNYLKNCGIIGYIGNRDIAIEVILQGLEEMQNRGYDSAGAVTFKDDKLRITKFASSDKSTSDALSRLKQEAPLVHKGSGLGLGHTRWATHGGKTDLNAHPHTDLKSRVAIIHNGTITNTHEILQILQNKRISPKTQTDSELIALMIGMYLDEGHSLKLATRLALEKMNGTWGLAVISKDHPDQIVVARRGSPMLIGLGNQEMFIGSEPTAFVKYTNKYISLEDNQIFKIDPKKEKIEASKVRTITEISTANLGNYSHWTLKEIEEQPESISRALNFGARLKNDSARLGGLEEIRDKLLDVENIVLMGCGTSLHACLFGEFLMKKLRVMNTVQSIDGSEMNEMSLPKSKPGVIAISQSGETRDIVTPMQKIVEKGVTGISIVNVVSSQLARLTGHGVYMNSGREVAVASTKSFMNSCVILAEISLWYSSYLHPEDSETRKKIISSLIRLPMQVGSVIAQNKSKVQKLAQDLKNEENLYIIGRGFAECVAKESALKIKELSQLHTEGYFGGDLKTGPVGIIKRGVPVVVFLLNDEEKDRVNVILKMLDEREANIIVVTTDEALLRKDVRVKNVLKIEENGEFSNLLALIPMQLLAYYLSIARGLDPDHPRNLAKVVTVE
jgi:glucosamine--fructose-6-phosphate aminotransferase (isomerizing)